MPRATSAPARRPGGRTARIASDVHDAVITILADRGVIGLQYEIVAQRSGVSRATLYRRWPSREDLIHDAVASLADLETPLGDTGNLHHDLVQFVLTLSRVSVTPLGRAVFRLALDATHDPGTASIGRRLLEERTGMLRDRLDAEFGSGRFDGEAVAIVNLLLAGSPQLYGARTATVLSPEDADRIVRVVLTGLPALTDGC